MAHAYQKSIARYREWIAKNRNGVCDPSTGVYAEIALLLDSATLNVPQCRMLCRNLSYCSNWYGYQGVLEVAEENQDGWVALARASQYQFWDYRIRCRLYDISEAKQKASAFIPNNFRVGMCALHCFSLGAFECGQWLGERLNQSKTDGSVALWPWAHPTTNLAISLTNTLSDGCGVENHELELGIYSPVIELWNDFDGLIPALMRATEFHSERTEEPDGDEENDFGAPVYDVFPAEILAIYRVRERLGLPTPTISHPLMATPFGRPPIISSLRDDITPFSPPSGPATGSFNGLHRESNFLAMIEKTARKIEDIDWPFKEPPLPNR